MTSGTSASAGEARAARTLYGLSPYTDSVRTQTAHFVPYTSANVPKRCLLSTYSLRTRGFIRGSIPLSSTIKRLVRRGSGKANGQKPKMYGHGGRIDGQDKDSGKLPVLLDCCVLTAYSCPMTTSQNTQRDELADEIAGRPIGHGYYSTSVGIDEAREIADAILAAGYRKPRTITTVEELHALPLGSVIRDGDEELMEKTDNGWCCWVYVEGFLSSESTRPATVLHEPEAETTP